MEGLAADKASGPFSHQGEKVPKFKNKMGVRLSLKVPGRKGLTFIEAGAVVQFTKQELEDLKQDNYVLESYLEPYKVEVASNEEAKAMVDSGEAVVGPLVEPVEPKKSKSKKKK